MVKIEKNFVSQFTDYDWLANKMDSSFEIPINDGKTKIIFGFNGIGKTSFTKCLRENNSDNLRFLDYESIFDENKNEITISPLVKDISECSENIANFKKQLNFGVLSKAQGYTKTNAKKGPSFMKAFETVSSAKSEVEIQCTDKMYQEFLDRNKEISPKVLFELVKELDSVSTSSDELDKYNISKYKLFLNESKKYIDNSKNECPVCGTVFKNIDELIDSKIKSLKESESRLVKLMDEKGYSHQPADIDKYIKLCNELKCDPKLLNDFVICGNDLSLHKSLIPLIAKKSTEEAKLTLLESQKIAKYMEIKNKEIQFKNDVSKYLKIPTTNIQFNDTNKEIKIILDREAIKYSTGERHILWFLIEIYSFIGSDSSTLIMDDPASSLDLINMYKIGFEIVKSKELSGKNLIIFTHSCDLINIINSQRKGCFDIYYIDELNGNLYCEKIDYTARPFSNVANVITTERLSGRTPKIFESLKERESNVSSPENLVYHYDYVEHFSSVDASLSNYYLINLIDSFASIGRVDFYTDCFEKIKYLLALRVWLEKKLYSLIHAADTTRQSDFISAYTLQEKINILKNVGVYGSDLFAVNSIEPESITSKKVMLNQNLHYYSQVQPFAYAMNISFDDLTREINELKAIF